MDDPSLRATDHDRWHLWLGKYGNSDYGKRGVYAIFMCSVLSLGQLNGSCTFFPNLLHPLLNPQKTFVSWEVISWDTGLLVLKPKWLATLGRGRGMGGTGCLGETGREGGGVAGEERGSHSSPSWDPGKVRLGIPRWQGYNPHPEAATHAVSSTE